MEDNILTTLKILIIGESGVGKSRYFRRHNSSLSRLRLLFRDSLFQLASEIRRGQLRPGADAHHRSGFQDEAAGCRREYREARDLGHGRPGEVQNLDALVLQGRAGGDLGVRRQQLRHLRQAGNLAERVGNVLDEE